jgi:glutamine kinase
LNYPHPTFTFGTKAETLERLQPFATKCVIPDFHYFTISEWLSSPEPLVREINRRFGGASVAVRSSASAEDSIDNSMAGKFTSVLDVPVDDQLKLSEAIETVITSYQRDSVRQNGNDHILIQMMAEDVSMSGVLFTQDLNTGAPYYVISYDEESGRTDTVTGGNGYGNRTMYVHRGALSSLRSPRFKKLVSAVLELEEIVGSRSIDVEFALNGDFEVQLFQVRRITTSPNWNRSISQKIDKAVQQIQSFTSDHFKPWTGICGHQSVFGQMPDWNPAEMIGRTPRPLALSLYRHVITDRVWRIARRQMGYAEPEGMPLMVSLGGQPYIDARLSFHSYLPADLPQEIGEKLVSAWLELLIKNHSLHDKVEFDVAVTAMAFDFDERVKKQFPDALTSNEVEKFRASLRILTNNLLSGKVAPISGELSKISTLSQMQKDRNPVSVSRNAGGIASLLEHCQELGTIPFSVLARHGFIAQSLLKSLVSKEVLTADESAALLRSIKTVAGEFAEDSRSLSDGIISTDQFMEQYGHLRPGTYDILSPRYDQRDGVLTAGTYVELVGNVQQFEFSAEQEEKVDQCLTTAGLDISPVQLLTYIKEATAAREYAKFVFTRNISDALEAIAAWGENAGLSREEMSLLKVNDILDSMVSVDGEDIESHLRRLSEAGAEQYKVTQALRLPQLLFDEEGVHVIPLQVTEPNFITHKNASGECLQLNGHEDSSHDLNGKIVLIENADPGFDWIFAHKISGLVTKYGGANSHMAIRCAEFGLPAAIGCGEQIFEYLCLADAIEIKCADGQIHPLAH